MRSTAFRGWTVWLALSTSSSFRLDDIAWIIDSVTHDFSKSGYTTGIEAKRKPGAVEDVRG